MWYIYNIYAVYKMSVEARCMKCKIKKSVSPCNFLKPRGLLQSTTASWLKLIFSNSSTHYIFYFILAG